MDAAPSVKAPSSRALRRPRHGSLKERPPSPPDSAYEHDADWTNGSSEEGGDKSPAADMPSSLGRPRSGEHACGRGVAGQDSDVDSGIVTCRKPGQRIGSTSSADTDSSQESRKRIEYSPPVQKSQLAKSRSYSGSLRVARRASCLTPSSGPIKADHSALKECNRRPPTPLTVFPDSHHCVRFDEQLQLSEQNIRRSCRKLFATLYAQRFSYPAPPESSRHPSRARAHTVPELDFHLDGYGPACESRNLRKENVSPEEDGSFGSAPPSSSRTFHKSLSEGGLGSKVTPTLRTPRYKHRLHHRYSVDRGEDAMSHANSTDSGLGSLRNSTQCTCQERPVSSASASSQSTRCTCRCCSCARHAPRSHELPSKLFKSSSCTTLSGGSLSHQSRPQLTQFPPRTTQRKVASSQAETRASQQQQQLHKTSSCSSLLDRASLSSSLQLTNVPVYTDNMVQVYARIASVIPDDFKSPTSSQGGRRAKTLGRLRHTADNNVYDPCRLATSNHTTVFADSFSKGGRTEPILDLEPPPKKTECVLTTFKPTSGIPSRGRETPSVNEDKLGPPLTDIYSQISDVPSCSLERKSSRESLHSRGSYSQRPKNVGVAVPHCGPNPVYLKSALKKPTQTAILNVIDLNVATLESPPKLSEVEYAVVDKSKKNRFVSLPALNGISPTVAECEEKDPPVPPKKNLHKSDFSLYRSRSSSPKQAGGLLFRMQELGRNARSALQKAFSSERIYRPEREERMEAEKGLQRSKSFIRGLTASFRKKKRKGAAAKQPEVVVTPSSPSSEWDEQSLGPNSPIHVRGQLLQLNLDGSQVVELTKLPTKPYGFFVARGRVKNSKGVFVSRMRDQETQKQLAGLLDIGDEILEIDGRNVKDADIMEVNRLMSNKNTLLLTVLPYNCRKDT